jgi:hypothetical protein
MAGIADLPETEHKTYAAWAELYNVPSSTFWHRVHGRPSRSERAVDQQYLPPSGEKALVDYVLRMAAQRMPSERSARIGSPSHDLRHVAGETFRSDLKRVPTGRLRDCLLTHK